jgi:replicative DNA helicase
MRDLGHPDSDTDTHTATDPVTLTGPDPAPDAEPSPALACHGSRVRCPFNQGIPMSPSDTTAETERVLLGQLANQERLFGDVVELLRPEDFTVEAHRQLFELMLKANASSRHFDAASLQRELPEPPPELVRAMKAPPVSLELVIGDASRLKEASGRRRLVAVCDDIKRKADSAESSFDQLLEATEQGVFQVAERWREGDLVPVSEWFDSTLGLLEKRRLEGGMAGQSTGLTELDRLLGGLPRVGLVLLTGSAAVGKTSLALGVALRVALTEKKGVAILSSRLAADEVLSRMLSALSLVDKAKLAGAAKLSKAEESRFQDAASVLWNAPVYVDDTTRQTVFDVRVKLRRMAQKRHGTPPSLVIIDDLEALTRTDELRRDDANLDVGHVLDLLAKELGHALLLVADPNSGFRTAEEQRQFERALSTADACAEVVLSLETVDEKLVDVRVLKARSGTTGTVRLQFQRETLRFSTAGASTEGR